jgi:hypothetical protein
MRHGVEAGQICLRLVEALAVVDFVGHAALLGGAQPYDVPLVLVLPAFDCRPLSSLRRVRRRATALRLRTSAVGLSYRRVLFNVRCQAPLVGPPGVASLLALFWDWVQLVLSGASLDQALGPRLLRRRRSQRSLRVVLGDDLVQRQLWHLLVVHSGLGADQILQGPRLSSEALFRLPQNLVQVLA